MLKKFIQSYYKLLDEKLENWTIVVIIIALIIVLVSLSINYNNNNFRLINSTENVIEINWVKYKLDRI